MAFCKNCGGMIRVRVKDAAPTREPAHADLGDCVKVIKDSYEDNEITIDEHTERINSLSTEVSGILNELRGRHADQHSMMQARAEEACSWLEQVDERFYRADKVTNDRFGRVDQLIGNTQNALESRIKAVEEVQRIYKTTDENLANLTGEVREVRHVALMADGSLGTIVSRLEDLEGWRGAYDNRYDALEALVKTADHLNRKMQDALESRIKAVEETLGKVRIFLKPEEDEKQSIAALNARIDELVDRVAQLSLDNQKAHHNLRAIANAAAYGV